MDGKLTPQKIVWSFIAFICTFSLIAYACTDNIKDAPGLIAMFIVLGWVFAWWCKVKGER